MSLQKIECFADEPCAPTYMEFDPDCYPPSCPWCALNAEIEAHSGCEHKRHGPWRRWKIVHKIEGWAYVLGIVSGARFSWGGGCSGCMTIYFKGRRPYILGWERWKWSCLFRGRHWPGEYVGLDACGKCLPCPECGSTTAGHKADCPTGWGDAA